MPSLKTIIENSPIVITIIYVICGFFWIQFSDQFVLSMFDNPVSISRAQSLKGWFFVFASGFLIFLLIKTSNNMVAELISELRKSKNKFESTFQSAPVGIVHHRPNEKWMEANQTLCDMLGYEKNELLNLDFDEFIHPQDIEKGRNLDQKLIEGKEDQHQVEKRYRRKNGTYFMGLITKSAVYNGNNDPLYLVGILQDITAKKKAENKLKQALKDKEIMLSEIHHRVRNNLALISALFDLQNIYTDNENFRGLLNLSHMRIKCLALIHDTFSESKKAANINISKCLSTLIDIIKEKYKWEYDNITVHKEISPVSLNINQAIPLGLICNELLMNINSSKFDGVSNPRITITLEETNGSVNLKVINNGKAELTTQNLKDPETINQVIINTLVSQLKGEFKVSDSNGRNTIEITFIKRDLKGPGSNIELQ
ncbi:MAG: PAS domain S-box protein [Balneolaceae bacterium]